jgi:hypothetical protein
LLEALQDLTYLLEMAVAVAEPPHLLLVVLAGMETYLLDLLDLTDQVAAVAAVV